MDLSFEAQRRIKEDSEELSNYIRSINHWKTEMESKEHILNEPSKQTNDFEDLKQKSLAEKELGNKLTKEGDWNKAIFHYTEAIYYFSTDATYYANRALCFLKTNQLREAETDCTTALQLDDAYVKALHRRAIVRVQLNQVEEAYDDILRAVRIDPNNMAVKKLLNDLNKKLGVKSKSNVLEPVISKPIIDTKRTFESNIITKIDDKKSIIDTDVLKSNLVKTPNRASGRQNISESSITKVEHDVLKTDMTKTELKVENDVSEPNIAKMESTVPVESSAIKIDNELSPQEKGKSEAYMEKEKGNDFAKKGQWFNAVGCYTKAIKLYPYDDIFYSNRAQCFLKIDKPRCALADCQRAIKMNPTNIKAYYRKASALMLLEDFDGAEKAFSQHLILDKYQSKDLNKLDLEKLLNEEKETNKIRFNETLKRKTVAAQSSLPAVDDTLLSTEEQNRKKCRYNSDLSETKVIRKSDVSRFPFYIDPSVKKKKRNKNQLDFSEKNSKNDVGENKLQSNKEGDEKVNFGFKFALSDDEKESEVASETSSKPVASETRKDEKVNFGFKFVFSSDRKKSEVQPKVFEEKNDMDNSVDDVKLNQYKGSSKSSSLMTNQNLLENKQLANGLFKMILSILNKITSENLESLATKMKSLLIDTLPKLQFLVNCIFLKAISEPTFCSVYARLCRSIQSSYREFTSDSSGASTNFQDILLRKCRLLHDQFCTNEWIKNEEKVIDNCPDPAKKEELRKALGEKKHKIRIRSLNNYKFIGELLKYDVLAIDVVQRFITSLLYSDDERGLDALCIILTVAGQTVEQHLKPTEFDAYFEHIRNLLEQKNLSPRIRFKLSNLIDLKNSNWIARVEQAVHYNVDLWNILECYSSMENNKLFIYNPTTEDVNGNHANSELAERKRYFKMIAEGQDSTELDKYSQDVLSSDMNKRVTENSASHVERNSPEGYLSYPTTYLQFSETLKSLDNDTHKQYLYLKKIKPENIPNLMQDFLEESTFSRIIHALATELRVENANLTLNYLLWLSKTKRFDTIIYFLNEDSKKEVRVLFDYYTEYLKKSLKMFKRITQMFHFEKNGTESRSMDDSIEARSICYELLQNLSVKYCCDKHGAADEIKQGTLPEK